MATTRVFRTSSSSQVPGMISQYIGATAPSGYLICDGSAVSRTTYSSLWDVLRNGTSSSPYGNGNGSTTFNLPNFKGRIPVGLDSTQTEFDALGETGGAKTHTLTSAEMPSHTHTQDPHLHSASGLNSVDHTTFSVDTYYGGGYVFSVDNDAYPDGGNTSNATATNQNTGGGGSHNNLQPYITVNYIIKT